VTGGFGVPYFSATEAGWATLLDLADDAAEIAELLQHQPLELLILDPAAVHRMAEWCRANGHRLDHAGRARWLAHMTLALNTTAGSA
jgi:hypothetical protein